MPGFRRLRLFDRASEEPYRRRTSDWVRVMVAAVFLVLAARHAGDVTASERALLDLFNSLPGGLVRLGRGLYRLGALWAVGLVVVAALVGRRWRLARDLLLSALNAVQRDVAQVLVSVEPGAVWSSVVCRIVNVEGMGSGM